METGRSRVIGNTCCAMVIKGGIDIRYPKSQNRSAEDGELLVAPFLNIKLDDMLVSQYVIFGLHTNPAA